MFPLAGHDFPDSPIALAGALEKGLQSVLVPPTGREMVRLEAPEFPATEHLTVDLTGCRLLEDAATPPRGMHNTGPAMTAARFLLTATPLFIRSATVRLEVSASNVRLDYARDDQDRPYLVPSTDQSQGEGGDGHVRAEMGRSDIESLLVALIQPLAAANGVTVEDTSVELESESPRVVRLHVTATGKKLFMMAKVHVYGRLQIDEELSATVDQLRCEGDGFIGEMAEKLIQPRLAKFDGLRFPLAAFSLGGLRLRDLEIATPDGIEVTAKLG